MHTFPFSRFILWFACAAATGIALLDATAADNTIASAPVDFKIHVRPILSNRCFACHGPDEGHVESGLRLDQFELATAPADSGSAAIVPGNISESEMVRRILSTDESERMPPPHFGARLTDKEAEIIQSWISSGAKFSKHWSFDQVSSPSIKPASTADAFPAWQHSAIDSLVLKKLHEKGWTPSPEANRETLLRRVTLDLTGLPPTIEQQLEFANNPNEYSYEELVDELLASPAFGEHWGRKWLDLARYADSAGYADDPQRTIWGYRDWVIRSINQGKSFNQFTLEQLAGDLLPNASDEQRLATAFHRNTLTNNEGGTNDEEFRNVAIVDRVNTTMAVWMGLTMGCAQCHSHKFDPISQKEYFQVFAILNQTEDADRTDESPTLGWYTEEQRRNREQWTQELANARSALIAPDAALLPEQTEWANKFATSISYESITPTSAKSLSNATITVGDSGVIAVTSSAEKDTYTLEFPIPAGMPLDKWTGLQLHSRPQSDLPGGGAGNDGGNFVLTNVSAQVVTRERKAIEGRYVRVEQFGQNKILSLAEVQVFSNDDNIAQRGKATQSSTDFGGPAERAIDGKTSGVYADNSTTHSAISLSPWWEVDLMNKTSVDKIVVWNRTDGDTESRLVGAKVSILNDDRQVIWESTLDAPKESFAFEIRSSLALPFQLAGADFSQPGFEANRSIDQDPVSGWAVGGSIQHPHELSIAINQSEWSKRLHAHPSSEPSVLLLTLKFDSPHKNAVLSRFSISLSTDDRLLASLQLPNNIRQLLSKDTSQRTAQDNDAIHLHYVSQIAPSRQSIRETEAALNKRLSDLKPITTVPILKELQPEKKRETFIQVRGNYKVHGELVSASLPASFHSLKTTSENQANSSPIDRLAFARWLMQDDNPLTARVLANRYWESFFGVGIVRTSEEFGSQGDLPANAELLDYLAKDLIQSNWDTKRFIRSIVLSAAYKQQSYVTPSRYEEDPDNVYVSRGPRFRVSAEQVRDMALASAGLLSQKMFGPPTRPPQPSSGLNAAFGSQTDWEASKGEDRFRRALYTQWRRSNPYPSMATFDAPNREVCVLKRDRTNTPLQALVTLNDPAFVEAAQGLARRVVLYELPHGTSDQRIERIFRHALSRAPSERELTALNQLLEDCRSQFAAAKDRASKLATDPLGPLPANADSVELASWTTVCNVVLNLDEFLMTP